MSETINMERRRSVVFLRSDARSIVHDACINLGVDAGALSNGQWQSLVEIAEELLRAIHRIGDGDEG